MCPLADKKGSAPARPTQRIPLLLPSIFRAYTWIVLGVLIAPVGGGLLFIAGMRGIMDSQLLAGIGAALLLGGVGAICRGLCVATVRAVVGPRGIALATLFGRRELPWEQVELYAVGLWHGRRPPQAAFRIRGPRGAIAFRTRPDRFDSFPLYGPNNRACPFVIWYAARNRFNAAASFVGLNDTTAM